MSILIQPINNIVVAKNTKDAQINLSVKFDDSLTTGLVAHFNLYDSSLGGGVTNVVLFDQPGAGAPKTVKNFLNYVNNGDYVNTIIHRSVPGFIIQGGGFTEDGLAKASNPDDAIETIATDPPVDNEFSPERSNLRGTIAMAKQGDNPNSATNQWFFNLGDNSGNLDKQNGGFTVFGEVLSDADLKPVDAIANLPKFDASGFFGQPAFTDLPLIVEDPANPVVDSDNNFVRYRDITVSPEPELQFTVVSNSNAGLVNATIKDNQLLLDYVPKQSGTAEILVRATNLLGDSVEDPFSVTVQNGKKIVGTGSDDILIGSDGKNNLNGKGASDLLQGNGGRDKLVGGGGNDSLIGGNGRDKLFGGGGFDSFEFTFSSEGADLIKDFNPNQDIIQISASGFGGGLNSGILSADRFTTGSSAGDSDDRFIYNQNNGQLFFDIDGTGSQDQVQIAVLKNKADLSSQGIFVI